MLLGHFENNSPEWHEARAGIGGSDIGTILGVNRWKTAEDLLNERLNPDTPRIEPNLAMRMGTAFEAAIRRLWLEDNQHWLAVEETGTWQSTENPFWKANPDGFIRWNDGEIGILEIKYSQQAELPITWVYQVQWYLMLLGLKRGIIVQCKGNKLIEHVVEANLNLQIEMKAAAKQFEQKIRNNQNGI